MSSQWIPGYVQKNHSKHLTLRILLKSFNMISLQNNFIELVFFLIIRLHFKNILIYLFLAVLGLYWCVWTFSSCGLRASHCGSFSYWVPKALGCAAFTGCSPQSQSGAGFGLSKCSAGACEVVLRNVSSSQTRDRTHILCISRQTLNHSSTGEALNFKMSDTYSQQKKLWAYSPVSLQSQS